MTERERLILLTTALDAVEDCCSDAPDLAGHGHSTGLKDAIRQRCDDEGHMARAIGPDGLKTSPLVTVPFEVVEAACMAAVAAALARGDDTSPIEDWPDEDRVALCIFTEPAIADAVQRAGLSMALSAIPKDWYLEGLYHRHTQPYAFRARPLNMAKDHLHPWLVSLRCKAKAGLPLDGTGETPEVALAAAIAKVLAKTQEQNRATP